jgi:hypothetical protein
LNKIFLLILDISNLNDDRDDVWFAIKQKELQLQDIISKTNNVRTELLKSSTTLPKEKPIANKFSTAQYIKKGTQNDAATAAETEEKYLNLDEIEQMTSEFLNFEEMEKQMYNNFYQTPPQTNYLSTPQFDNSSNLHKKQIKMKEEISLKSNIPKEDILRKERCFERMCFVSFFFFFVTFACLF